MVALSAFLTMVVFTKMLFGCFRADSTEGSRAVMYDVDKSVFEYAVS